MQRARGGWAMATAVGLAVVAVLVAFASTGGSDDEAAAVSAETLQAAAANASDATSMRFRSTIEVEAAGESAELDVDGVMSGDGQRGWFVVSMPEGSIPARVVDGRVYMFFGAIPGAEHKFPDGKRWVVMGLPDAAGIAGDAEPSLAEQSQQGTPQQGLTSLEDLTGDVQDLGSETLSTGPATHYRGELDYAELAEREAGPAPDGVSADVWREQLALMHRMGTVPVDVWIDASDRVVKMRMELVGGLVAGEDVRMLMTMEIAEFGVPVDVQAPPADEVISYEELASTESI